MLRTLSLGQLAAMLYRTLKLIHCVPSLIALQSRHLRYTIMHAEYQESTEATILCLIAVC